MMTDGVRVDGIVGIPPHRWYEFIDKLTRIDDLIEILIKQVDRVGTLIEGLYRSAGITVPSTQTGLVLIDYTTSPLPPRGMWIGAVDSDPTTDRIVGTVYSDAEGVLYVEQSADGENWDVVTPFEVSPSLLQNSFGFSVEKVAQYARIRYANMSNKGQKIFRLYVYAKKR
jgi:hypothetical protein